MKRFTRPIGVVLGTAAVLGAIAVGAAYGVPGANGQLNSVQCVSLSGRILRHGGSGSTNRPASPCRPTSSACSPPSATSDSVAMFNRNTGNSGKLTQRSGNECISETGAGGCEDGHALDGATDVANVDNSTYVAAANSGAVVLIKANSGISDWHEPSGTNGCVSNDGSGGTCTVGRGLAGASSVAIRPGSGNVYVGGTGSIAVFSRAKQSGVGQLTQLQGTDGCVSNGGSDGCASGFIPDTVRDIRITSDGKTLYAAASGPGNGAVLVFKINSSSGALTQLQGTAGCISEDGSGGQCTIGRGLLKPEGISTDRDSGGGLNVYVASNGSDAVAAFSRNKSTGALTQLGGTKGCVSETASDGCADGHALTGPHRVNVYKTNKYVEVTAGDGVASFARDKKTGALTQLPGLSGCTSETGLSNTCFVGPGLAGAMGVVTTGGGKNAYVAGSTVDALVVLKLK